MKILHFFMHPLFPIVAGNQANTLELCNLLNENNHEITLMYVDYEDKKNNKIIEQKAKHPFVSIYSVPFYQKNLFSNIYRKVTKALKLLIGMSPITIHFQPDILVKNSIKQYLNKNKFDIVIIHYIFATKFLLPLLNKNTKTVLFAHCLIYLEKKRFYPKIPEWWHKNNRSLEMGILKKYDKIILVGDYEKKILINNDIDEKNILLCGVASKPIDKIETKKHDIDILFVSGSGKHNIDGIKYFIKKIFPEIKKLFPSIILGCVGPICNDNFLFNQPNIKLFGYVEDLKSFYARSKIVINPVFNGVGVKVKTVEALSHGCIVVTSENGKEGISNLNNDVIFVCKTDNEWIRHISDIFNQKINVNKLRNNILLWSKKNIVAKKIYSEVIDWIEKN